MRFILSCLNYHKQIQNKLTSWKKKYVKMKYIYPILKGYFLLKHFQILDQVVARRRERVLHRQGPEVYQVVRLCAHHGRT